ncbi:MAG: ATP-binding protein [Burkholderiaceae bacterium]
MRWPQPSFPQLLLAAFLLIGLLLGGTAVRALFSLESLMAQSQHSAAQAVELTSAAQSLAERSLAMERAARQSLVLRDTQLRQQFEEGARQAADVLRRLEDNELPAETARTWRGLLTRIQSDLDDPLTPALDLERLIAQAFRDLEQHNRTVAQQVQGIMAERNRALQARLDLSRRQLALQVTASLMVSAGMAIGFGVWLARPLRRLENAIVGLGENRLTESIEIPGPPDIRRVGQQLEWLRLRLTELDADKARFLRHVSHELKTPLASLHEGVAVLGDGVAGPLNDSQAEVVRILRHNTRALQEQIEALLHFNAVAFEARQLKRQPTDLLALVDQQVEGLRLRWQSRQIDMHITGEAPVMLLDPDKMGSAIGNLLLNAIRFAPSGSRVDVTVARTPGQVQIDIADQGPGVDDEDRPYIFEPFFRGRRQPEDAVRGTGVGLSIVQEYIQAHGGTVALLPAERGAHFRIELPHAS